MLLFSVKGVKQGLMKIFQGLLAADLEGARDDGVLLDELFGHRTTENKDFQGVEAVVPSSGWLGLLLRSLLHDLNLLACCGTSEHRPVGSLLGASDS